MDTRSLYAPWRMEYIRSLDKSSPADCFLCQAATTTEVPNRSLLLLWRTDHSIVLINRFPYTSGHLLIAPRAHMAELEDLAHEQVLDMQLQSIEAVELLKRSLSPQGFNIGINLGRCAGAGLPGHVHQHVVPRWAGDTNFISVVGDARVIPEAPWRLFDELVKVNGR